MKKMIIGFIVVSFSLIFFLFNAYADEINILSPKLSQTLDEFPSGKYSDAEAVILLKEVQVAVEDGKTKFVVYVAGKILKDKAKSDYNQIFVSFNSYYEDAIIDFAHTYKDNEIINVSKDAVQIKTYPELSGSKIYSDRKAITFSLPALDIGSIFEYQVTITRKLPIIENNWFEFSYFNYILYKLVQPYIPRLDPVFKSRLILKVPEGEKFLSEIKHINITPTGKKEDNFTVYKWEAEHLPAIELEQHMPSLDEIAPQIHLSSIKNWDAIDNWASIIFYRDKEIPGEIKAMANNIIKDAKTENEKIEALFYYVQSNIEYVAADLNRGGYAPHPLNEIIKNRYGDCKDQGMLLIAMLREVGIMAYPALLNPYPYNTNMDVPTPRFSHLIVYIPGKEKDIWLDTTSGVTQFPGLFWANQGQLAFIINGKGGRFLKTPESQPGENYGYVGYKLGVKDETLNGFIAVNGSGAISDNLKAMFKQIPINMRKDAMSSYIKYPYPNAHIKSVEFSDLNNPGLPFNATEEFELPRIWNRSDSTFSYYNFPLILLSFLNNDLRNLPAPENRKYDYLLGHKFHLVKEESDSPPDERFKLAVLPQEKLSDSPFFSFSRKYISDGNSVKTRWDFLLKQDRIRKDEYKEFYEGIQDMLKKSEWMITFNKHILDKKGENLEDIVKKEPVNVLALLDLSKHYLIKGKYKEAVETLEKAVSINASNGEIHYFLGMSYGYLDKYDEANNEFKKARDLGYRR